MLSRPELVMKIDLNVIEHLGLKMYTSLPAVIAEYVANAWDAGATVVDVKIPTRAEENNYGILIADNGFGMSVEEVNEKFLVVGRNRRDEDRTDEIQARSGKKRKVIGRKGIGKLAGFGVAGVVKVRTVKDGKFVEFQMDYDEMKRRIEEEGKYVKTDYRPQVLDFGETQEDDGACVTLLRLKRKRPPDIGDIRRNLARHFSVLSDDFVVRVNDEAISPEERDLRAKCEFVWDVDEFVDEERTLKVTGWIGTMSKTVPSEIERGIVVMARGKLVQTPTLFDVGGKGFTGMHALSYLIGELHAEFLDDEEDLVGTGRRSVVWETEEAQKLRKWANEKIKTICKEWVDRRAKRKLQKLEESHVYDQVINLPSREQNILRNFLSSLAKREDIDEEALERVAEVLVLGVEYKAFLELVEELDRHEITDPKLLVKFFRDWELMDSRELARVYEGRLHTVMKFKELLKQNVREVPDLHDFLVDNPWLLDPRWDYIDEEVELREIVQSKFGERSEGRIDILCLGYGQTLNVVELKRPGHAATRQDLEQVERYVDYLREQRGSDFLARYQDVVGYLIVGSLSKDVTGKVTRLAQDRIFVRTYEELKSTVMRIYKNGLEVLKDRNKRLKDRRLEESLNRLEQLLKANER